MANGMTMDGCLQNNSFLFVSLAYVLSKAEYRNT